MLERVRAGLKGRSAAVRKQVAILTAAMEAAADTERPVAARLAALQAPDLVAVLAAQSASRTPHAPPDHFRCLPTEAWRSVGSWYEFFPRSEGATRNKRTGKVKSGNFKTAAKRLDAVAAMGFDVIYLPPIHPIGEVNRKGPNNTLTPGPMTPVHRGRSVPRTAATTRSTRISAPFETSTAFVEEGQRVLASKSPSISPSRPRQITRGSQTNPEWFTTRADGTIAYAENPPKKYQDIYPINFDNDPEGLDAEVLRIVRLWMSHGVRIFRVDNPHTKPLVFWEWLLGEIRKTDPDVLFLSEAFTRPAMMHGLGSIGFHQSYTYFTWRTAKWEIEAYLLELAQRFRSPDAAELLREHPRHPARVFAVRRPGDVQDSRGAGGHGIPELGRVRRV